MIALAGCCAALAAVFAGMSARAARLVRTRDRIGGEDLAAGSEGSSVRPMPSWVPWTAVGAAAGWIVWIPWGIPAGAVLGGVAYKLRGARLISNTRTARDEQLADAVASIAAALRAGLSVPRALAYAASETPLPLGASLRAVVREIDLGVPTERAIDGWAAELGTGDARLLAGVLRLNRRSGGDLPAVLDQVLGALRDRREAAMEVGSLTAQARLSGVILGFLPIAFFAFLWLTSRSDIEGALRTSAGIAAVALGLFLEALAFLWIRKLLEIR